MRRSVFFAVLGAVLLSLTVSAQQLQSGRNVNASGGPATKDTVTGVPILGDPYLQRQNEPSLACSVRNPLNCLLGANDYRTVDVPNLAGSGGKVTGDAWLGAFWTRDGGQSWRSNLLPGFPQDQSAGGVNVPMKGFDAAADPTVRAGSNGLLYYSGIAFNRAAISGNTSGAEGKEGVLFLATFIDDNNTQQIDTPFRMVGVTPIVFSTPEKFTDKPWLAVDIPRGGSSMCTIPAGNGVPAQAFPGGNVYVVYTVFQGDGANIRSKLMFTRSTDCGKTFEQAQKLSESFKINQSATIGIHPTTGQVLVAWREFASKNNKNLDGVIVARSDDFGKSFRQGVRVGELTHADGTSLSLDQPSLPTADEPNFRMFRTNTYPSMCVGSDGTAYLAWAQRRVHTSGDARILYSTSTNGSAWSAPMPIDNFAARGHQGMPALACGGNKVTAIWYDQREDALGWLVQNQLGWGPFMADPIPAPPSRTIDVRAAEAVAGEPFGASMRISRYQYGLYDDGSGPRALQLEYNLENLPLFGGGKIPFMGDYIDVAPAPAMLPAPAFTGAAANGNSSLKNKNKAGSAAELAAPNGWAFNTSATAAPVFHAAWADNRDVRAPGALSSFDAPACSPGTQAGTKNQNIYTTRLSPGVAAGALGNARPYGELDRAFSVYVQNTTAATKEFSLTIATQLPGNIIASFSQFAVPNASPAIPYPMLSLQVKVAPYSGVARTVFVQTTTPGVSLVPIRVDVNEIVTPPAVAAQTSVVINPDPTNPAPLDAAVAAGLEEHLPVLTPEQLTQYLNPNFINPNFFNPNFFNPNFFNPNFFNPNFINPNFINPNFINPNFINPNFFNPNFFNPNFINQNFENPNFINPNFINPNFINPNFINQPVVTELNWTVESGGNTASSYLFRYLTANPLPPEWSAQLLIYRLYYMPAPAGANPCNVETVVVEEKLVDIQNPNFINAGTIIDFTNPNFLNSALSGELGNATFALGNGDAASIKLRIAHDGTFNPATVTGIVIAGAVDSDDAANNITAPDATLAIVPAVLPEGTTGAPFSYQFMSVGGAANAPKTWSLQGGTLPPGISFSSSGLLQGTPTVGNGTTSTFTAAVTDGTQTVQLPFNLSVYNPLLFATVSLPRGVSGTAYATSLLALGGKAPYQWSLTGGTLPTGITLSPAGVLSGTTAQYGLFTFTSTVADSGNPARTATSTLILAIGPKQTFVVQPTNTPYLETINPDVVVQLTDGNDVPVPANAPVSVTLTFASNPTAATLFGNTTVNTNAAGQAVFTNVRPSKGGGVYTLQTFAFTVFGPASSPFTVTPLSATVFDTIGDNATVDLASGTVVTDGQNLTLTAQFGPGFDPNTSAAVFNLDTDQNIATGNPGPVTGGGFDEQATGNEYFVWLYPNFDANSPTRAAVYKYLGPSSFSSVGVFPLTVLAGGYTATIPLSTFSDDGLLNFKVTSSKQLSTNGYTGLLDSAPDVGLAPGTITPAGVGPHHQSVANEPGTMHWLNGTPNQRVAQVITPTSSGLLTELRAYFDVCDVSVQVQGVTAGQPNGVVLMPVQTFTWPQMQTPSAPFDKLVFSSPAAVVAGTPVAIVLDAPNSCGVAAGPNANFYPGGAAFRSLNGGAWTSFGAMNDIAFQIKIKP